MRISLGSMNVDDRVRRAVNFHYGRPGLATRQDVLEFYLNAADSTLEAVVAEYDEAAPAANTESDQ